MTNSRTWILSQLRRIIDVCYDQRGKPLFLFVTVYYFSRMIGTLSTPYWNSTNCWLKKNDAWKGKHPFCLHTTQFTNYIRQLYQSTNLRTHRSDDILQLKRFVSDNCIVENIFSRVYCLEYFLITKTRTWRCKKSRYKWEKLRFPCKNSILLNNYLKYYTKHLYLLCFKNNIKLCNCYKNTFSSIFNYIFVQWSNKVILNHQMTWESK